MYFSLPPTVHRKNICPCSLKYFSSCVSLLVRLLVLFLGRPLATPGCHISAEVNKQALASVTHTLMRALQRVAQSMPTQP